MRNPLYDVIIGNISGFKSEDEVQEIQAVVVTSEHEVFNVTIRITHCCG